MDETLLAVAPDDPLLPRDSLLAYLRKALGWVEADVVIDGRFPGGNANVCFALSHQGRDYVLRRPPAGKLPPKAHDMKREFGVLQQIHPQFPLAPEPLHFCADTGVLGVPFLLMERRRGRVIRSDDAKILRGDPVRNRAIGEMMIRTLAEFHAQDPAGMIANRLGRPDGFIGRQWRNWHSRMKDNGLDGPDLTRIATWLDSHLPGERPATIIHNDFKLDNLMLDPDDLTRPVALLDWDLCTVGDPLFDLGVLMAYWVEETDPEDWILGASMPTHAGGFPTRAEAIDLYARLSGRPVEDMLWYVVFGSFRVVVSLSQIYRRYRETGQGPAHFADMGRRIEILTGKCLVQIENGY